MIVLAEGRMKVSEGDGGKRGREEGRKEGREGGREGGRKSGKREGRRLPHPVANFRHTSSDYQLF